MRIGVIADDFTGGTDIASFLVKGGLTTVQFSGVPQNLIETDAEAIVISLKSRSCSSYDAVEQSLEALHFLQQMNCTKFYFKYCSTFDSTSTGNIGPVTDALMHSLKAKFTIICPSLPLNGRCVFEGNLYVNGVLLNESGMKDHPITPMRDSNLIRLMDLQSTGKTALINYQIINQGSDAISIAYQSAQKQNKKYAVVDAFDEQQLFNIAASIDEMLLITGGSGLAFHIANRFSNTQEIQKPKKLPKVNPTVVLSGSCSQMTNIQVENYKIHAPSFEVEIERCLTDFDYAEMVANWAMQQQGKWAPLIYATANVDQLNIINQTYGTEKASLAVETFFSQITQFLAKRGISNFIVAGGETSGVVTQQLRLQALSIGQEISPGVPWVFSLDGRYSLALKSGNFGSPQFFKEAQEMYHG